MTRVPILFGRLAATLLVALAPAAFAQDAAPPPTPEQATEAAFTALLTLPQGLPEGSEFLAGGDASVKDQPTLQAALEADVEAGAAVDAMKYGGTLLHHALRANLQDTALWLLAHDADPRLEVADGLAKGSGHDALQLAIVLRRWRVVDALLRRPAVAPHTPRDLAFRWIGLFDKRAPRDGLDAAARELGRRLAWPGDWYGGCLATAAQRRLLMPMLLKGAASLPVSRTPEQRKSLKGRDERIAAQCPPVDSYALDRLRADHAPGGLAALAPSDLARVDERAATPLLQTLAALATTPADVAIWAALPLRRPWQDKTFARVVVWTFLVAKVPPDVRAAQLRTVPTAALRVAQDDDDVLAAWLARLGAMPTAQAIAALDGIDGATLRRHASAAFSGLAGVGVSVGGSADDLPHPTPELWNALLARLPAPLVLTVPASTYMTQPSWPALFSRGYRPTAAELVKHWEFATLADWPAQWAQLGANATPETVTEAMRLATLRWSKPCDGSYQAPQPASVQALVRMAAGGARLPPSTTLSRRCVRLADPGALQTLLAMKLAVLPPGEDVPAPRPVPVPEDPASVVPHGAFVLAPRACAGAPPEAIVRAAVRDEFLADVPGNPNSDAARPAWFQPIDEPGSTACAWLVNGGIGSYRQIINEDTFFDGHYFVNPCVEPTLTSEVWRVVDGRVVASSLQARAESGVIPLKEADGPRRFLLTLPVRGAGCDGGARPEMLTWTGDSSSRRLMSVWGADDPAYRAYARQCPDDDAQACLGVEPDEFLAWQPQSARDFVAANGDALRLRWIAAFLANDTAALQASDVFPAWRADALAALTASTLPLADKRRRIAWMFRDHEGLARSFSSQEQYDWADGVVPALTGLVAWLPREDWRPLVEALGKDNVALGPLRDAARAKGDERLTQMFEPK